MKQMSTPLYPVTLALLSAMLCVGCSKRQTPVEIGDREGILHFGNGSDPQELDPHVVTGLPEHNIISALLEGLVGEDPETLAPAPGVAKSWSLAPDKRTYTFTLREEARWSNGDPVTANDFVYSYKRMLSPELGAPYAYMLFVLEGAQAFNAGETTDFSTVGVKAIDAHTLELKLTTPTGYFLSMLPHYSWFPVHPPTLEAHGATTTRGTGWTKPGSFVGNGPFTLQSWKQGDRIVLVKSPTYWDADRVKLNQIHIHAIGDAKTEQRAFEAGQLHVTSTVDPSAITAYRSKDPSKLHIAPYLGTYYYVFNTTKPALQDARVRRAMSMAINRQQIVDLLTKGGEMPAFNFTPPGTGGYTAEARITENIDEARRLLAEAGFPDGNGFPSLEILYNNSEGHQKIAEVVRNMWQKNLGITVNLISMEWKVYLEKTHDGQFDIARASWIADYNDPNSFLDMWLTNGGNNRAMWMAPLYDELIHKAAKETDTAKRFANFQAAETILLKDSPIMPIYFYVSKSLIQPSVQGWHDNILDHHPWKYISLVPQT